MRRYTPLPVVGFALENAELYRLQKKRCFLCGFKMKRGLTREHVWIAYVEDGTPREIIIPWPHAEAVANAIFDLAPRAKPKALAQESVG
jgi:hypothetical protein